MGALVLLEFFLLVIVGLEGGVLVDLTGGGLGSLLGDLAVCELI